MPVIFKWTRNEKKTGAEFGNKFDKRNSYKKANINTGKLKNIIYKWKL